MQTQRNRQIQRIIMNMVIDNFEIFRIDVIIKVWLEQAVTIVVAAYLRG